MYNNSARSQWRRQLATANDERLRVFNVLGRLAGHRLAASSVAIAQLFTGRPTSVSNVRPVRDNTRKVSVNSSLLPTESSKEIFEPSHE